MARTIKFHLDEHVDSAVASGLRRRGVDLTTTCDVGLAGASDARQLQYCIETDRVIYTNDQDFLVLATTESSHPGIVFSVQSKTSIGDAIRNLLLVWEILAPDDMKGRVEYM